MTSLADIQRSLVKEAYAAYLKTPTASSRKRAEAVLADCTASATAVMVAARHLLGPAFVAYEPESLWLQADVCTANRDKLLAGITLAVMPAFYWDYRAFGATTQAINEELVQTSSVPKCRPEQMAWSSFEAELLFALNDEESTRPEYDSAVAAYVAATLYEDGYVLPPVGLGFCAEELDQMLSADAKTLKQKTSKAWAELPKDSLPSKYEDDALGAQLTRLAGCWKYVASRASFLREQLSGF